MRRCLHGILLLAAAALPGLAVAQAPKLAIGGIRGDSSAVRRQLLLELCGPYQCVAASKVTTESKPDPQKLARAGVAGYLSGAVTGEPGEQHLTLSLATPEKAGARTWKFRLTTDGKLRQSSLDRFTGEVGEALSTTGRPPPSAAAQPPSKPPPAALPPPRAPPPAAPPAAADKAKPLPPGAEPPRGAPAAGKPHDLRYALQAGIWLTNRHLTYSGASAADPVPLRTFDASVIAVPEIRAEVYPAAFGGAAGSVWNGIGLYAEYGHSIGLKVKPPSDVGGSDRSGALTDLALGALWRLQPLASSRFTLTPALAYRSFQVVTGGADIPGLPDTKLSGLEGRLDLAFPVTARVTLLGGGAYQQWFSAKDLVGTFFPSGSAHGFAGEGGVDVKVTKPLSVRALLQYESVSYTLEQGTTGVFTATGAKDTYLGAHVDARLEF
jgi:hypothetical protein